jgi:hypothetical protein
VEKVAKNVSKLVSNQQLAQLTDQSPALVELLVELKERVSELREKVTPLRVLVGKVRSFLFFHWCCIRTSSTRALALVASYCSRVLVLFRLRHCVTVLTFCVRV